MLEAAGVALAAAAGMTALVRQARSAAWAPPPPGATAHFTDLCVKCGLCVKACPFGKLKLAGIGESRPGWNPLLCTARRTLRDVRRHPLRESVPVRGS
ncbi:MAG: 4Fe-4S binding protein [Duodenibacillus massiliensis]